MLKKTLLILLLAVGALLGGGAFFVWSQTKGESAAQVEAAYLTKADRFVEIDGARVRVREEGLATGPTIVLIHGFTFSLESWDGWAANLKKDFRVIRYDLLGHGLTGPDPQERYAPAARAAFLGKLLEALEVEQAIIAGNSLGGLAAWRYAAAEPTKVKALILISPGAYPHNGVTDQPAPVPDAMKAYLLLAPEAGVQASAEIIYGDDLKITAERLGVIRAMMRREGNGEAMIKSIEQFTLPDPEKDLAKITAPTLILWGEEDLLIPSTDGYKMRKAIPQAHLITYPGVGHSAQEEAPEQTVEDARKFLALRVDHKLVPEPQEP